MAQLKSIERRFARRWRTVGFLPGQLISCETGETIPCRALDVSEFGMGVFSEEELQEGGNCILDTGTQRIHLEILWVMESPGVKVGFRYGLKTTDPDTNLKSIFEDAKCL